VRRGNQATLIEGGLHNRSSLGNQVERETEFTDESHSTEFLPNLDLGFLQLEAIHDHDYPSGTNRLTRKLQVMSDV